AIVDGHMAIYFPLAEQFTTQTEPSFCGLGTTIDEESSFLHVATLAMSLNALRVDPCRQWKSAWRWYSDDMLDCCTSVDTVKQKGLSFDEFIALARLNSQARKEFMGDVDVKGLLLSKQELPQRYRLILSVLPCVQVVRLRLKFSRSTTRERLWGKRAMAIFLPLVATMQHPTWYL
ncbi:unnamed protein product, partial [Aphanomyces euteiches]